jgi:hypothetical protein
MSNGKMLVYNELQRYWRGVRLSYLGRYEGACSQNVKKGVKDVRLACIPIENLTQNY